MLIQVSNTLNNIWNTYLPADAMLQQRCMTVMKCTSDTHIYIVKNKIQKRRENNHLSNISYIHHIMEIVYYMKSSAHYMHQVHFECLGLSSNTDKFQTHNTWILTSARYKYDLFNTFLNQTFFQYCLALTIYATFNFQ